MDSVRQEYWFIWEVLRRMLRIPWTTRHNNLSSLEKIKARLSTLSFQRYSDYLGTQLLLDLTIWEDFLLLDRCKVKEVGEDRQHYGPMIFSKLLVRPCATPFIPFSSAINVNTILYRDHDPQKRVREGGREWVREREDREGEEILKHFVLKVRRIVPHVHWTLFILLHLCRYQCQVRDISQPGK